MGNQRASNVHATKALAQTAGRQMSRDRQVATNTWQATVDVDTTTEPTEDQIDELMTQLQDFGAALGAGPGTTRLSAILTVSDAATAVEACTDAATVVRAALDAAGLQVEREIALEAITDDEADRRLLQPMFPELVAATEAASILDVSRQRVHQLYRDNPRFPEPVLHLTVGPVWTKAAIERFNEIWTRKPGRPSKADALVAASS